MTIERSIWILCLEVIFLSFHTVLSLVSADVVLRYSCQHFSFCPLASHDGPKVFKVGHCFKVVAFHLDFFVRPSALFDMIFVFSGLIFMPYAVDAVSTVLTRFSSSSSVTFNIYVYLSCKGQKEVS